jgi:hypothetical protein
MTFLEQLQAHKGGLIHLKTQLYWCEGRRWDNNPGRICLILDAARRSAKPAATGVEAANVATTAAAIAHLLIDGQPAWIWVTEQDIELLVNDQPIS